MQLHLSGWASLFESCLAQPRCRDPLVPLRGYEPSARGLERSELIGSAAADPMGQLLMTQGQHGLTQLGPKLV